MARSVLFSQMHAARFASVSLALLLSVTAGCGGGNSNNNNNQGGDPPDMALPYDIPLGPNTTLLNVFVTWYGFNDNSCQVETDHNCNTIGYPKMDGFPTPHNIATEGKGTYDDPSTFATAADDEGMHGEMLPGTIIYIPYVRKYFVMEDQCAECNDEWAQKRSYHVDVWMGPSYGSDTKDLETCEDNLTLGDGTFQGTGTVIVNPPSDLPVDTTPLFTADGKCTTATYTN
jgi:hypothetical protein